MPTHPQCELQITANNPRRTLRRSGLDWSLVGELAPLRIRGIVRKLISVRLSSDRPSWSSSAATGGVCAKESRSRVLANVRTSSPAAVTHIAGPGSLAIAHARQMMDNGSLMLRVTGDQPSMVWESQKISEKDTDGLHSVMSTPWLEDGHIYGPCSYGQLQGGDCKTSPSDDFAIHDLRRRRQHTRQDADDRGSDPAGP